MPENNGKIILYMHAGSGNHGCEAIVNGLCRMLNEKPVLISFRKNEDLKYSLKELCDIYGERSFDKHKLAHVFYYIYRAVTGDRESFIRYRYGEFLDRGKKRSDEYPVAVSIGGDNYCYDVMLNDLFLANSAFNARGIKTVLLGCSIEPELLVREDIKRDLKKYHTIIARESITYEALKEAFEENSDAPQIYCIPDPAFTLPAKYAALPDGFAEGNTVGINISPMIQDNEEKSGIAMEAYKELISFVIENTDMQVALIPHVVWESNDDRKPINELYGYFKEAGYDSRVIKTDDADCETLKGYIARCRFFVGARTHSTIAAYSSCVPTLVVGYSIKARGIAKDLFPKRDVSSLVLPVQELKDKNELKEAFKKIMSDEDDIRRELKDIMPEYIKKAGEVGKILQSI